MKNRVILCSTNIESSTISIRSKKQYHTPSHLLKKIPPCNQTSVSSPLQPNPFRLNHLSWYINPWVALWNKGKLSYPYTHCHICVCSWKLSEFHYEMRLFHFLTSEEHKEDIQASNVVKSSSPHFTHPPSVVNRQNTSKFHDSQSSIND